MDEVFSFTDSAGVETNIFSGRLRAWILDGGFIPITKVTFPEESFVSIVERHGIELNRLLSMTAEQAAEPIIIAQWADNTHCLVDGGHRRAWHSLRGNLHLDAYVLSEDQWRPFCFDPADYPAAMFLNSGHLLPQRRAS